MVSDKTCNFAPAFENKRAFSSVGLEHLPYKQRVGGSNPSTPTNRFSNQKHGWFPEWPNGADCKSAASSFGGSNPSPPGWFPEWPNGADCKSAASSFGGSNPSPPTSTRDCFAAVSFFYPLLLFSSFILFLLSSFFYPLSFILFILHPIYWVSSGVLAKRCSCCLPCSKILTRVARYYLL